ncbi:MAG: CAP domain-containing protein [Pyrinomonadaceae bacterium]
MKKINFPPTNVTSVWRGSFLSLLFFAFLFSSAIQGYAQGASVRPVARLVSSSRAVIPSTPRAHVLSAARMNTVVRPSTMPAASATSLERRAFDLINAQRRAKGESPLVWDADLCRMARQHSQTMASQGFFNHVGPDGLDTADRARRNGLFWKVLGENIAYNQGYADPAGFAVERWMVSGKHRANILNPQFNRSAIGVAQSADGRVFLTQVFIAR